MVIDINHVTSIAICGEVSDSDEKFCCAKFIEACVRANDSTPQRHARRVLFSFTVRRIITVRIGGRTEDLPILLSS